MRDFEMFRLVFPSHVYNSGKPRRNGVEIKAAEIVAKSGERRFGLEREKKKNDVFLAYTALQRLVESRHICLPNSTSILVPFLFLSCTFIPTPPLRIPFPYCHEAKSLLLYFARFRSLSCSVRTEMYNSHL